MTSVQFIQRDGKREYAIVPIELFEHMAALMEEQGDTALFDAAKLADDGFRVPGEVLHAILDGSHPVKVWREYRGMTQEALAEQAGISKAYLCQIETGKRQGAVKTLKALAGVLGVALEDMA